MALTKIDDRGLKTPIDLLDNEKIRLGTGNDLQIYHSGSHAYLTNSTGFLIVGTNIFRVLNADHSEYLLQATENRAVELYYDGSKKFETSSYGVWLGDNSRVTLGGSAGSPDCHFYHDATNTNIQNITGDLIIKSNSDGDKAIVVKNGAATELYYDNVKKYETSTAGSKFTGGVSQVATAAAALDLDLNTSNFFTKTISGNSTFTFSNPAASGTVSIFML